MVTIKDVVDKVDAVSIVVPTDMHYEVADYFIKNNKHILIEKPFASNVAEAEKLEEKARDKDIILQIGHLERFNKAFSKLKDKVNNPLFIECNRISPFKIRGTEVNVVMDLMIHDLDIVMSLNKSNIKSIKASGASVLTDTTDIANARVEFENGCVCNLSASRISDKIERKMRVFQKNSYFSLDYQACKLDSYKKIVVEENKKIEKTRDTFLENDPLNEEVKSFINCIKENKKPLVDAVDGIKALKYAITISNLIKK
jgi:predicted dehydrogenase